MCFSASASFGAGVILSVIGVASIKKVQSSHQVFFASIPLIFAVQQISEGFLWLALSNPDFYFLKNFTTYFFLFFAQVVWPVWVPVALWMFVEKGKRRTGQKILVGIGSVVSLYLAICLASYDVYAAALGKHIAYIQDYPLALGRFGGMFYMIATIFPPLFSGIKRMWALSLVIGASYVITSILYKDYIVSVWCFFASLISIVVYFFMRQVQAKKDPAATVI